MQSKERLCKVQVPTVAILSLQRAGQLASGSAGARLKAGQLASGSAGARLKAGLPGRDAWLMLRRSLGHDPEVKYYLSNAPADVNRQRLAVVGSERWRVEGAIKEAKRQTALDESEGRNWKHWYHRTTLSMLAYTFLTCARANWAVTHPPSRHDGRGRS